MIWPLTETLAIVEPRLPGPLISEPAFTLIKDFADVLPNAISSYYLECRLAADRPQVDLLACVKAANRGREILREYATTVDLPPRSLTGSCWSRVRDFCTRWAEPRSSLHKQVSHIWLEFDGEASPTKVPSPNLLLCLDPEYFEKYARRQRPNSFTAQQYWRVTSSAFTMLLPRRVSPLTQKNLFSCFALLPPEGYVIHTSVMFARQPSTLKLNIAVPKEHLLGYLRRLDWQGSLAAVETLLSTYCACTDRVKFQLTIGNSLSPSFELEFHFDDREQDRLNPRFVLDQLVENELCTLEKRDAFLTWAGSFRETFSHRSWPTRFYKWVDVKIIYHPEHPLQAKGYLGFMPSLSIF